MSSSRKLKLDTIIEIMQHETARLTSEQSKTKAIFSKGFTNCLGIIIRDKKGNLSLTHFDSATDIDYIFLEIKKMQGPYSIEIVHREGGGSYFDKIASYIMSNTAVLDSSRSMLQSLSVMTSVEGNILADRNQTQVDVEGRFYMPTDPDLYDPVIDRGGRGKGELEKRQFERLFETSVSNKPTLPKVVFDGDAGWQSFPQLDKVTAAYVYDNKMIGDEKTVDRMAARAALNYGTEGVDHAGIICRLQYRANFYKTCNLAPAGLDKIQIPAPSSGEIKAANEFALILKKMKDQNVQVDSKSHDKVSSDPDRCDESPRSAFRK